MIRFISFLLGREYESCKSCQTLKEQLIYQRDQTDRLTNVLLDIIKPKTVESQPVEINQIQQSSALFSRRRAALEAKDREEARILRNSTNIGKPDDSLKSASSIESLEHELGIVSNDMKRAEEGV